MMKVAPALDLWPVVPMISVSAAPRATTSAVRSPMARLRSARQPTSSAALPPGTTSTWWTDRCFRTVPATTFTLTVMANAHRIASGVLGLP